MTFGEAIEELNKGNLVCRKGWNGKGMFIYKTISNTLDKDFIKRAVSLPNKVKDFLIKRDKDVIFNSSITMYTAAEELQPGWLASQADIFAEDWEIFMEF